MGASDLTSTDEELVARARLGDQQAVAELSQRYRSPLGFIAQHRGIDASESEDVVQAFYLRRFLRCIRSYDGRARFKTYVRRAFENFIVDWYRRKFKKSGDESRNQPLTPETLALIDSNAPAPDDGSIAEEERALAENWRAWLQHCLGRLTERARQVVVNRYYGGMTLAEVAASLDSRDPANVFRTCKNALKQLRKCLTSNELGGDHG